MKKLPIYKRFSSGGFWSYRVAGYAWVDDEDLERASKIRWGFYSGGYAGHRQADGSMLYLHQFIMGRRTHGRGDYIDHKNGNPLDCRKSNLRFCTQSQNIANSNKNRGKSKHRGVWYSTDKKRVKRWAADIKVSYKKMHLGRFETELEAAAAYNKAAIKYFGEFARLNQL